MEHTSDTIEGAFARLAETRAAFERAHAVRPIYGSSGTINLHGVSCDVALGAVELGGKVLARCNTVSVERDRMRCVLHIDEAQVAEFWRELPRPVLLGLLRETNPVLATALESADSASIAAVVREAA